MTGNEVKIIKKNSDNILKIKKLRVAAYVRVSTKKDTQSLSFESQINYYRSMISQREDWILVNIYSDYGKSGRNIKDRDGFINMISDCIAGKIDLIFCKSVSRFARNSEDCIKYFRLLKKLGVRIIFEEENIDSNRMDGELLLTLLATIAQQESENISAYVKLGKYYYAKLGKTTTKMKRYGYNYDEEKGKFVINKKEAKVVRKMFDLALNGVSLSEIAKVINREMKSKWQHGTIAYVLNNMFYIGVLENNKKNSKTEKTFIIYNHHVPIIKKDTFYKVQEVLKSQKVVIKKYDSPINFYKAYCGSCNGKIEVLYDSFFMKCYKYRKEYKCLGHCDNSIRFDRRLLESSFNECLLKILLSTSQCNISISNLKENLNKNNNIIKYLNEEKIKFLDTLLENKINKNIYNDKIEKIDIKIKKLESKNINIKNQIEFFIELKPYLNKLYEYIIDNSSSIKQFDKNLYEKIVDKVIVGIKNEKGYYKKTTIKFIHIINRYDVDFIAGKSYSLFEFYNKYPTTIYYSEKGKEVKKEIKTNKVIFEVIIK